MKKTLIPLLVASAMLVLIAGCRQTQTFQPVEQICTPGIEKAKAMEIAEEVLGQMHFTVEKADLDSGFIRTAPLRGAQFFEFWRTDNVGAFNSAEANLQTIRRVAELNIDHRDTQLCIDCKVKVYRLNLPEHKTSSGSYAYAMFSESGRLKQRLELSPEQKQAMNWADLGTDEMLSSAVLNRIENKIAVLLEEKQL